jgi:hypothetical protein
MQVWQNKYVWGVPCFGGFVNQIMTEKKGAVVWPLVGMFGGSMSLDCFGGFLDQITTGKKVQSSGHRLQCLGGSMNSGCFVRFVAMSFRGFLDQITNYNRKKKVQSSGHRLECLLYIFDSF